MRNAYLFLVATALFLFNGLAATANPRAMLDQEQLLGQWAGALPMPSGSHSVSITVSMRPDGGAAAVLHPSAATGLNNSAMRVGSSADSVVFYADKDGYRFAGQPMADGRQLRGVWQHPGFRTVLVLDRSAPAETVTGAPLTSRPTATYRTEEVRMSSPSSGNSEIGLGGTLNLPAGTGPFAAVVLLPDVNAPNQAAGAYSLLAELADYLARQGLAVLRLDERGTGRSAGVPAAKASTELVADAQSALSFLRTRPGIDPLRVGLLGHGEGANVALLAAAQAPAPAFLVALGAAGINGQELLARQTALVTQPGEPDTAQLAQSTRCAQAMALARREAKKQLAAGNNPIQVQVRVAQEQLRLSNEARKRGDILYKRQYALLEIIRQTPDNAQAQAIVANMLKQIYPSLAPATAQVRAGQLTSAWYRSFLTFDPQAELGKVACPALLLHGTADDQVSAAANLSALEKGLKGNKRLNVEKLEGVSHSFQAPASEQALANGSALPPVASADALETIRDWVFRQVK